MKLVRFEKDGKVSYGSIENDKITLIEGDIFGSFSLTREIISLDEVRLLAPCTPNKAICVGLNYKDHAEEVNIPLPSSPTLFMKPSTTLIGPKDYIEYPEMSKRVDYECELVIVIKKEAKNVSAEQAKDVILGYTCGNDVTARDLQPSDGQWTLAKSFDTFMPLGPWIATDVNPYNLNIKTYLNGEVKQNSNTKHLIFGCFELVSYISRVMTLKPGDVIMTGTPSGIAAMNKGDKVEIEIESIGKLVNYLR
ncbi:ureidoglycolate lyase [Oxobacter pfennigii]|uniref:Ureidoglycolate lyase n=1 Tax=Oxobacter pfennigii TaxID=36849 RepID=A0A0N8NU07_9CLOT|nr:fumarylacetoacetate hydrolase family protein [Oxobacter pfennigii]KPU46304.1 ureidoglycolate lyase [Oxobacter pfennigii]